MTNRLRRLLAVASAVALSAGLLTAVAPAANAAPRCYSADRFVSTDDATMLLTSPAPCWGGDTYVNHGVGAKLLDHYLLASAALNRGDGAIAARYAAADVIAVGYATATEGTRRANIRGIAVQIMSGGLSRIGLSRVYGTLMYEAAYTEAKTGLINQVYAAVDVSLSVAAKVLKSDPATRVIAKFVNLYGKAIAKTQPAVQQTLNYGVWSRGYTRLVWIMAH